MSALPEPGPARAGHPVFWGSLMILVSAASFGAMAIFGRLAYASGADVPGVLLVRFALATAVLAVITRVRGTVFPAGRARWVACAMGAVGYVGQSACFFGALKYASAGLVGLLLYLYPTLVTLLAAVFLHERLTPAKLAVLAVSFAGVALTVGGGDGQPLGIALGVAAAVIYSGYILVGGRNLKGTDSLAVATLVCASAAAVFALWGALFGVKLPATPEGWLALLAIALVSTVVAISTFFAGMARLGASRAAILSTFEPVVTLVLAAAVLGEAVGLTQAIGGAMILAAAIWVARAPRPS